MELQTKLAILADAAKYDASCASSGSRKRDAVRGGQGSAEGMGICHSYTPGGRSLDAPGLAAQLVQPMLLATPAAVPQQGQLF